MIKRSDSSVYRNVSAATAAGMADLMLGGRILRVRDQEIREIRNNIIVLTRPMERCLFMPHRGNNIFVSLAETLWVLAGRNDIHWLGAYLPRASAFSDDGFTWRAGYGPRLRNWKGIDQIDKVRELLLGETATRRAAMSLFDPGSDYVESKDIPCNNWLHWLIRDKRLHLNLGIRSNDIVWGFSGVNSFEWSILQEMMAFWVGVEPGEATYFASSFHIYERHYAMAEKAVREFRGIYCYDFGLSSPKFCTPWIDFEKNIAAWFEMESEIRKTPNHPPRISDYLSDPLLIGALDMVRLYHGVAGGWDGDQIKEELSKLPGTDFSAAAYEFFGRKHPQVLDGIPNPSIAAFVDAFLNGTRTKSNASTSPELLCMIKALHREKDAAYGSAWKRRGELISILANIARKVDRLEQYDRTSAEIMGETLFDTALDLYVYSVKYILFLLERSGPQEFCKLPGTAPQPFSDHVSNFDWLVDNMTVSSGGNTDASQVSRLIVTAFEQLYVLASSRDSTAVDRLNSAIRVRDLAFNLVLILYSVPPRCDGFPSSG